MAGDPAPESQLDRAIHWLQRISVLGGLGAAAGFGLTFFLGTGIYSAYYTTFGVAPFTFNLNHCLEHGGVFLSETVVLLPILLLAGVQMYLVQAADDGWIHVLFWLSPFTLLAIRLLRRFPATRGGSFCAGLTVFNLVFLMIFMFSLYLTLLDTATVQDVLLDPAVNAAIEHSQEIAEGASLEDFGIEGIEGYEENLILGDVDEIASALGGMILVGAWGIMLAVLTLRSARRVMQDRHELSGAHSRVIGSGRKVLVVILLASTASFLFLAPGRMYVLSNSIRMPRVDASIDGLEHITSRYYMIQMAEYDDGYAFYVPNLQDVIRVRREEVRHIRYTEFVPLFSDRFRFEKRTWLGVRGGWRGHEESTEAQLLENERGGGPKTAGWHVSESFHGSPARQAGILPGDTIRAFGGKALDGAETLDEILAESPLGEPIDVRIDRDGVSHTLQVELVIQP